MAEKTIVSPPSTLRAFYLYLIERFPPHKNIPAIFILYCCTQLVSSTIQQIPVKINPGFIMGFIWLLGVFYHLRVLDDLKDKNNDLIAYPNRVLSRGWISYSWLLKSGIFIIVIETLIAFFLGTKILLLHFLTLIYSLIMYKEFFVRDWLKQRIILYAITHMGILAFIDFNVLQMLNGDKPMVHNPGIYIFALVSFFMTFSLEVARKIRIANVERDEIDTYSKSLGIRGSIILSNILQLGVLGLSFLLLTEIYIPAWFYITNTLIWLMLVIVFHSLVHRMTDVLSKKLENIAAIFYITFYVSLIVHLTIKQFELINTVL